MPVDRPTFSESWYRVAALRPRLRSTVQIHRQHYRGRMWYVLQDPSNNQFFRQNEAAYHFVAMLDGRRNVGEVWRACNEELGDAAPTQGEAIQLLGQLYTSNLIQCELPPDAQGLFSRFQKRRHREVKGYLSNLLFIRIPLFDPDRILDRWVKVFGRFFSPAGMVLWIAMVSLGLYHVISNFGALRGAAENVLDPEGLPLLYLSFVFIKVIHEFGHAFACKRFGQRSGGGEVHVMGVMFLVFTPLPYVDASSSWAFRSKWHRVIVGAGGMIVEMFVAAIAAVVWARTADGAIIHTIAYNVMFIASVSTLLFNANPLLRYDGYYILSDLLEIPNLSQRSKDYLYYLVKRYVWRVRNPRNPSHTNGERAWFVFYGIASTIYRFFICFRILLFVADKLVMVGFVLAVAAAVTWVCVPVGKFIHYLATSGELIRVRGRAMASVALTAALIAAGVGVIRWPDRQVLEGVVEPQTTVGVFVETDGWVVEVLPNRTAVTAGEDVLVRLANDELTSQLAERIAARQANIIAQREAELKGETGEAKRLSRKIVYDDDAIAKLRKRVDGLVLRAPVSGVFTSPKIEQLKGAYLAKGRQIGLVADLNNVIVRCTAGQDQTSLLKQEAVDADALAAEIRAKGRPDDHLVARATLADFVPAGQNQLFSQALSYAAGGSMATDPTDQRGVATMEKYLEIRFTPDDGGRLPKDDPDDDDEPTRYLMPGQRVVVRVDMPERSLMQQWMRKLRQLVKRRFQI